MAKKVKKKQGVPTSSSDPRLAQYLADPGLRSKLSVRLLSPEQRTQREHNADPYYKPVQAAVRAKYDEPISQVKDAIAKSGVQQQRIGSYFDQYQQALKDAAARNGQEQAAAVQNVAGMAASLAALSGQQNQAQSQAMGADAQARGATVDPGVAKVAADANLLRNALGNTDAATLATQGVNNQKALGGQVAAVSGQKAIALQDEATRGSGIEKELRKLMEERGAYGNQIRGELQDADYKRTLEAKAFGLDQAKLDAQVRDQAQRRIISRKNTSVQQQNADANTYRAHHPKPGKKPKPTKGLGSLTPEQEQTYVKQIQALSKSIRTGGGTRRQAIAEGPHSPQVNETLANAANDLAKLGYISPANVKALQKIGIHAGQFPRSKQKASKQGTTPNQTAGDLLKGIGDAVIGLPSKPKADA